MFRILHIYTTSKLLVTIRNVVRRIFNFDKIRCSYRDFYVGIVSVGHSVRM